MAQLHIQIFEFFEARMGQHSAVRSVRHWRDQDRNYFAEIARNDRGAVNVFLTDAYDFGIAAYYSRPTNVKRGWYILIARPESDYTLSAYRGAKADGIGLGKIGDLMGALNKDDVSEYTPLQVQEEEQEP